MRFVATLLLTTIAIGIYLLFADHIKTKDGIPVSLVGVHHLGSDYYIDSFYVDKYYGGNVGEGGGGGGMVCCLTLPREWRAGLKADVRWEVVHIIRSRSPEVSETAEAVGSYRAQVPVEAYIEPGDLYVHFFAEGRARIVVSESSPSGKRHPIQWDDPQAVRHATIGKIVKSLFTAEEIAESERDSARDRAKYGDWR
jgi:hypothetical protein